jgi:hypothetical protein
MRMPEGSLKSEKMRRKPGVMSLCLGRSRSERTICDMEYSCSRGGCDLEGRIPSLESRRIPGGVLTRPTQKQSLWAFADGKKENRHVRWGHVKIQSHALVLGDNPCCVGPPLSSAYLPFETVQVGLDQYELTRPEARNKYQFAVPKAIREEMLKRSGYSRSELCKGAEEALNIRMQRKKSNKLTPRERFESLLKRMVVNRNEKRQQITEEEAKMSDSIRNLSVITYKQADLSDSIALRTRVATDQEVRISDNIISGMTYEQATICA